MQKITKKFGKNFLSISTGKNSVVDVKVPEHFFNRVKENMGIKIHIEKSFGVIENIEINGFWENGEFKRVNLEVL